MRNYGETYLSQVVFAEGVLHFKSQLENSTFEYIIWYFIQILDNIPLPIYYFHPQRWVNQTSCALIRMDSSNLICLVDSGEEAEIGSIHMCSC